MLLEFAGEDYVAVAARQLHGRHEIVHAGSPRVGRPGKATETCRHSLPPRQRAAQCRFGTSSPWGTRLGNDLPFTLFFGPRPTKLPLVSSP
ncbi:hypothetical protein RB195_008246 [Necator americanus]|uniref:Uncharacterized protein n=1 Tax=Necator americanus TaxID=51031 RepID=A0ABR1CMP1_NECAM